MGTGHTLPGHLANTNPAMNETDPVPYSIKLAVKLG